MKPKQVITIPAHVAIILDGNGRWAKRRGMPRTFGHQRGVENIKTVTLAAQELGIKVLSVYAFSTENWNRPKAEVDYLMTLPKEFEEKFSSDFEKYNVKVMFSGRKTKMSEENREIMERMTRDTAMRTGIILNICFDYGSKEEITQSVQQIAALIEKSELTSSEITPELIESHLYTKDLPPVDLMIRPSGEQRLSNFLLWQLAYAELYFTPVFWPAFSKKDLEKALEAFTNRDRRYGAIKG
ncbi:MAG: isoprenyl transferase [Candidatus Izemoplasmatales bacterium]|nr:isoprenyl transferase [Candidatus Izemoplasmatales bacterium]